MARCYITGKGNMYGRSHTHHRGVAGGRWKKRAQKTARIFKPNLQTVSVIEEGVRKQIKVSAKALKRIKKDMAEGKRTVVTLVTAVQA
ncbi:MAG TPA: 50S ribosomal protein L28 [Candidatus Woesebacteria bacterium]|nr:50S ribosomal protein L28 [Candidatus Woesebacteria bacterium]HNS95045.1 50S ribosomal protein L28 [Candidatus Woesebacteria bacterium]